jgi:hypothetical protein
VIAKLTLLHVKIAHTVIFWFLSACVVYTLYSAVADRVSWLTWMAAGFVLVESVVLAASGWVCPLTLLAERLGADRGSVADIFLPRWLADRIFPICGTTYLIACLLLVARALR